ncbi:MAG: MGMT family protein [Gammaproteobacteria bacterium]|nr:MGMT family protein [Gammaproteobacteria bacterium]
MSTCGGDSGKVFADIEQAVLALRPGEVTSYGCIARRAGWPGRARYVSRVLRESTLDLPWHRVVRADGRIAFPQGSQSFHNQVQRLEAEGISVTKGRVSIGKIADSERDLDRLLWAPPEDEAAEGDS